MEWNPLKWFKKPDAENAVYMGSPQTLVEMNHPDAALKMMACIKDAKKLVNKEVLVFGREDDVGHDAYIVCVTLLAQSLFRENE